MGKGVNKSNVIDMNPSQVDLAWDTYVNCGVLPENQVRSVVGDSWARCLKEGVDPSNCKSNLHLDDGVYQSLLGNNSKLLAAAKPIMERAKTFLAESGSMMILTDKYGTCLHVEGDPKAVEEGYDIELCKGANWSESAAGTNAIGTVLSIGRSVQINTTEHFCEGIKSWTCTAAVIRDPDDHKVIGSLDISALGSIFTLHTQALVVEAAGQIESRLARIKLGDTNRLLNAALSIFSSPTRDALILLDNKGLLVKANENVVSNLAIRGVKFSNNRDPVGHTSKVLEAEWLRSEWLEPITEGDDQLGSIVVIPSPHHLDLSSNSLHKISQRREGQHFKAIIGSSPKLKEVIKKAERLALRPVSVLIQGETGVGKELFAKAIHVSGSNNGPLVTLNCGGLSRELITSELFGYVEGAFTGAVRGGKMGKIEAADGGTLFLDEIGEMPLDIQANLLRVLQEREICRLGDHKQRKVDFRLLAATNRDLNLDVQEGRFRADLFYRISVIGLIIPALHERKNDIEELIHYFSEQIAIRDNVPRKQFDKEYIKAMKEYRWPGNIRELQNVVEHSLFMCQTDTVTLEDLPDEMQAQTPGNSQQPLSFKDILSDDNSLSLGDAERIIITSTLEKTKGNYTKAAKELGIAKSTLYLKLKKHGLDRNLAQIR